MTDRGPDSPGVVARVLGLVEAGRAVLCMGNHDEMLINAVLDAKGFVLWHSNGGDVQQWPDWAALAADAEWLKANALPWYIDDPVLFSQAMRPNEADPDAHLWGRPTDTPVYPLPEGVTVNVHGHTPMYDPFPIGMIDGTVLWFIDTGAVWTEKLCAFDCETLKPTVITLEAPAHPASEAVSTKPEKRGDRRQTRRQRKARRP
ncbi:hypothetical protein [Deinococcus irradiatisoli]|uniref:hypothetical protein n=1 Tax=Deinococcus irradiatisoli TaxID=2202254 RepID=UPI001FECE80E|nr:hypothetical protein [Deinococcus irradiatisoli]